jgi:4-amino-4-deoxy-L-arabinose transferase-like glycosyltransferase
MTDPPIDTLHAHQRRPLTAIVLLFATLAVVYSLVTPLFEAPDEVWHFSFIQTLARKRALPIQPTDGFDIWLREAGQPPLYHILAALLVAPIEASDFPAFVRFNLAHPDVTVGMDRRWPNVFIHTPHEAWPYRGAVLAVHLARLYSVVWGVGTVIGTFLLTRQITGGRRPTAALFAASLVALNPRFIFMSAVVNNDATAACLSTFTLWFAVRLVQERGGRSRTSMGLGISLGLAMLSKMSAVGLLMIAALSLCAVWWQRRACVPCLRQGAIIFGLALLIAGWWYGRNIVLYGDPLGWQVWLAHAGAEPSSTADVLRQLREVFTLFWAPYIDLFPWPPLAAIGGLCLLGLIGWLRAVPRLLRSPAAALGPGHLPVVELALWAALLSISLLRFMASTPAADGRLLFPAVAALAVLLTLGTTRALPGPWPKRLWAVTGGGLLILAITTPFLIDRRFGPPLVSEEEATTPSVALNAVPFDTVRLLGLDVELEEEESPEATVSLYWQVLGQAPEDLRTVVRIWTPSQRLLGQRDSAPASEVYPPDLWQPGAFVRSTHAIDLDANLRPAVGRVDISVLAGDELLGRASSGRSVLRVPPPPVPQEAKMIDTPYRLGHPVDLIALESYTATQSLTKGEDPTEGVWRVILHWRTLSDMGVDYTVFVHMLDRDGALIGQCDGPPVNGDYPTSHWAVGDVIVDEHTCTIQDAGDDARKKPAFLSLGLYEWPDGARLPAYTAGGAPLADRAIRLTVPDP